MYSGREPSAAGGDDSQQDAERQRHISAQYGQPIGVQDWNNPMYYESTDYAGQPVSNFPPVGGSFNEDINWMESYTGKPSEMDEQDARANFSSRQLYDPSLHRTASAPAGGRDVQRPPIVRSQSSLPEPQDPSSESSRHSSLVPEGAQASSSAAASSGRRTPSTRYSSRPRLEEENRLLLDLRDRQRLPWRQITRHFEQTYGREYRMPTLQMRYGRLKNSNQASRQRQWTDADTEALRQAWQWYMEERWRIIADRMPQFGATEQWTAEECELVWRQLSGEDTGASSGDGS